MPYLMSLFKGKRPVLRERQIDKDKDPTMDNLRFEVNTKLATLCVRIEI